MGSAGDRQALVEAIERALDDSDAQERRHEDAALEAQARRWEVALAKAVATGQGPHRGAPWPT
jgi:hypothetical protein